MGRKPSPPRTPTDELPGKQVRPPRDPVVMGRLGRPVGVRGFMRLRLESDDPDRMRGVDTVILRTPEGYRELGVAGLVREGAALRIRFAEVDSPEAAARLNGCELVVAEAGIPAPEQGSFYIDSLIGCVVVSDDGEELGFLTGVIDLGHHDVWAVEGEFGEILIPAVAEFIKEVDLAGHRVVVKRVDGLWEGSDDF